MFGFSDRSQLEPLLKEIGRVNAFSFSPRKRWRIQVRILLALHPTKGLPHHFALIGEAPGSKHPFDKYFVLFRQGVCHTNKILPTNGRSQASEK